MIVKNIRSAFYFFCILFLLSSCSPFGNESFITQFSNTIADIFDLKTTNDMNSGGSQTLVSAPASLVPSDVHEVTISAGNVYGQTSYVTQQGHVVEVVLTGIK